MSSGKLSIVNFSTADNEGGSARSAYRIHCGLSSLGHNSKILVGKKVMQDKDVDTVYGCGVLGRAANLLADRLSRLLGYQYLYVPSSGRMMRHPWLKKPDIIQLYNTHGGYFSHTLLPKLSKIAPIVWRLSDLWPMTPHSAYTYSCECWKNGPENCVCKLSSYPPIYRNTKKMLWEVKERAYKDSDITVVAPSSWTENIAKQSKLLSRFPVYRIPNGIDLSVFKPQDKAAARAEFGISKDARVILFSAHGLDNNPRKGSNLLIKALNGLNLKNSLLLLVGEGGESFEKAVSMEVKRTGFIKDPAKLAKIYSCADFVVVPSEVENLPNNLLECMACGVPSVAFDAGGMKDAVKHMETGYLAKNGDTEDFAAGIKLLAEDKGLAKKIGERARELAVREFDQKREAENFEKLYIKLCSR
ncbi:glycosyltransferase [Candidatus Peregrinibacteria bacterium]|nr:glycosyltransferase [Candidatus Peregrinibacteria bacterium]